MNRRDALKTMLAGVGSIALPNITVAQDPKWFTQKQLLKLFSIIDEKVARETVKLKSYDDLYLSLMRLSNIMYRRTMDNASKYWIVVSPAMCSKDIWPKYMFSTYTTPGKEGGSWIKYPWQNFIKEEVSNGVYDIGCMNGKWHMHVCKNFPDNKIMLGMGYKQVFRYKIEGEKEHILFGKIYKYPNFVQYMGTPTSKNYAMITLKN